MRGFAQKSTTNLPAARSRQSFRAKAGKNCLQGGRTQENCSEQRTGV
jgi:hypothetical protein